LQIAAPLFLVALIPWAALVLWLLLGKRRRVNVPFLELWKGPVSGPTARRRIGMPPLALTAVLAALLMMIVAAAGPGIGGAGRDAAPVVIVVDRGITMSMGKPPRFEALLAELRPMVREQFGDAKVQIVYVPQGEGGLGTAIDTREMLEPAVREQLELNADSPVIVLSDQHLSQSNERLVQMAPHSGVNNISIAGIAARISPVGQVMVKVRNQSSAARTALRIENARQEVDLPPSGEVRDYFLPIDANAKVIRVEIETGDDFAGDNVAYLVRRGSWPIIEARIAVFAELARLIEKYSRLRPGGAESKRVAIVS